MIKTRFASVCHGQVPRRTRRRSQSCNKHASARSIAYYKASLHSHNRLYTMTKRLRVTKAEAVFLPDSYTSWSIKKWHLTFAHIFANY